MGIHLYISIEYRQLFQMVITQELLFGSHFFVAFVVSAGILALVSITYL